MGKKVNLYLITSLHTLERVQKKSPKLFRIFDELEISYTVVMWDGVSELPDNPVIVRSSSMLSDEEQKSLIERCIDKHLLFYGDTILRKDEENKEHYFDDSDLGERVREFLKTVT